jgi:hypothetical protein
VGQKKKINSQSIEKGPQIVGKIKLVQKNVITVILKMVYKLKNVDNMKLMMKEM